MTEKRSADEALAALGQLVFVHTYTHAQKSIAQATDAVCTCVKVKGDD